MKPHKLKVPDEVVELIRSLHPLLKRRIKAALLEIVTDPFLGKNLRDEFKGLRSFRIKRFKIIYRVSPAMQVSIIAIGPRKYVYEETFRLICEENKLK